MTAQRNLLVARLAGLEGCQFLEHWYFQGGAVHLLLKTPAHSCGCGAPHCWYVNRDGRTRCFECDQKYVQARDAFILRMDEATAT